MRKNKLKFKIFCGIALLTILVASCRGDEVYPDPTPPTLKINIDRMEAVENSKLFSQALKNSNIYNDLTEENYPVVVFYIDNDVKLTEYIEAQGLTSESFLQHPNLPEFVKSHLSYSKFNTLELRQNPDVETVLTTESGNTVTITTQEGASHNGGNKGGKINGVPINLRCLEDEQVNVKQGLLCFIEEPIVKDFSW